MGNNSTKTTYEHTCEEALTSSTTVTAQEVTTMAATTITTTSETALVNEELNPTETAETVTEDNITPDSSSDVSTGNAEIENGILLADLSDDDDDDDIPTNEEGIPLIFVKGTGTATDTTVAPETANVDVSDTSDSTPVSSLDDVEGESETASVPATEVRSESETPAADTPEVSARSATEAEIKAPRKYSISHIGETPEFGGKKKKKELIDVKPQLATQSIEDGTVIFDVLAPSLGRYTLVSFTFENMVSELKRCGCDVNHDDIENIKWMIEHQINTHAIDVIYTYKLELGWSKIIKDNGSEELVFKGSSLISTDMKASYDGNLDIAPVGNLEELKEAFKSMIAKNPNTLFWIVTGLAANLNGYLAANGESVQTPIIDCYGDSGTGKSTVSRLAVAMSCNPKPSFVKESLSASFNTTKAAVFDKLGGNYGLLVLLDEVSSIDKNADLLPLLYNIANGTGRARHNEAPTSWATVVILTNETSIFDRIEAPEGIQIRILSIGQGAFTNSAENAIEIDAFCEKFHGLPADVFARTLFRMKTDEVVATFRSETEKAEKLINLDSNLKTRAAKIVALYTVTAAIASVAFEGVEFDRKWLKAFLIDHLNKKNAKDKDEEIYDKLMQYVSANRHLFRTGEPENVSTKRHGQYQDPDLVVMPRGSKNIGYFVMKDVNGEWVSDHLVILQSELDNWLKREQGSSFNIRKLLRNWAVDDRYLIRGTKKDRLAVKKDINGSGTKASCYMIRCDPDISEPSSKPHLPSKAARELLSDDEDDTEVPRGNNRC